LQETEDKVGQQTLRNGVRPKQKRTVQDARDLLTDLPNFFLKVFFLVVIINFSSDLVKADETSSIESRTPALRIIKKDQKKTIYSLTPEHKIISFNQRQKQKFSFNQEENQQHKESETSKQAKKKIKGVAELYEKQFLREMVKQMRSTVSFSDISKPSFAEGYFSQQLDEEYVEKWGDQGGIGMGNLIYKQLLSQYGSRMGITE
jgi:hypothetical protein